MLSKYAWIRIKEQVSSVAFIILYLVVFQTLILSVPLSNALGIAGGIALVVFGLAFFLEGLILGLMPLGETCLEVGAAGAVSSNVNPVLISEETSITMIRSAISIPADITDKVVDRLLEISTINENNTERIQVLDSPAAYVRNGL